MKIHLERPLPYCPPTLKCIVCGNGFGVGSIRALLCNDTGLIYGDVCPTCVRSHAQGIRQKLSDKLLGFLSQHRGCDEAAIELQELLQEDLHLPPFYQWWWKTLEIFAEETQELERARLGLSHCRCGQAKKQFRIVFQDEGN